MLAFIKDKWNKLSKLSPNVKKFLVAALTFAIVFELVKIIPPFIFKKVIDSLITFDPTHPITFKFVAILALGYFGALFAMSLIEFFMKRAAVDLITDAEVDVLKKAVKKLLTIDLSYHEKHNTGASVNKLVKGTRYLVEGLFIIMDNILPITLQSIITLIVLLFLSWQVALTYALFICVFFVVVANNSIKTQKVRKAMHDEHEKLIGTVAQSIINVRTVQDFDNSEKELKKSKQYLDNYDHLVKVRAQQGANNRFKEDFILGLARMTMLLLAGWLMFKGEVTAGTLVLIITLTEKTFITMSSTGRIYYRLEDGEPSIERFNTLFDEEINIKDNPDSKSVINKGEIVFDNVTFNYDNDKKHALHKVSFDIPSKKITALVGRSGAGKSTIVKLLLRHFDVGSGRVLIDDHNIKEYSLKNLKGGIAIVSQDVELFDETILENIAYGVDNASKAEVVKAAKLAHAHEFIIKFEKGYDTSIGERGIRLSGGQKQRLAIARALLRKPKIMIFDEATSSLDAESEKYIHKAIFKLTGKVTLIIIAHRFSTISKADKIILLENGRVREVGTQKELLSKKTIFAKLMKLQKIGEVD